MDEHNLNVIAKNERLNVEGAREEMLTNWFGSCANPTWRAVVNALKEIKENHLARQLETKFCPGMCTATPMHINYLSSEVDFSSS